MQENDHIYLSCSTQYRSYKLQLLLRKRMGFFFLYMISLSNDLKWMCKGKRCFSGEIKYLGRSLVLVLCPRLFFGCFAGTVGSLAPATGSGSGQGAVAAVTASGTGCNLPRELAFAMPVGCGLRLKEMDNCRMPDVSCKPPVYFWCTQRCSLCLQCMGRKPSLY